MQLKKILVVDDSINNLDVLVDLLEGYDVIDTTSGVEAIEILKEENVDLILLDIVMPDMNGLEVCQILKSNPKTENIPIMFITSKTDEGSIEKAYEIGGSDYITKPFKAKELLAKVNRELQLQSLIAELKQSKKEMEHLACTDHLTQLYNRRYFMNMAENTFCLTNKKGLCIIMMDIDKFKSVNDTYGHKVGDDVLILVAKLLKESIRKTDILSRFGGEEFIMVLPETSIEEAKDIAENIRKKVQKETLLLEDQTVLAVTISMGVSVKNNKDTSIDEIIVRADEALYEAKNSGRNRVCIN